MTPTITHPAPASYNGPLPSGLVGRLGVGRFNQIAASPSGKRLAIASSVGIYIYKSTPFEQERLILTDNEVHSIAWSMEGKYLAGCVGETVTIWETETWSVLHHLATGKTYTIKWSPRSDGLATIINVTFGVDEVKVWNVNNETIRYIIQSDPVTGYDHFNLGIDWSSTDKLAVTDTRGPLRIYRGETGELIYRYENSPYRNPLAWSPDGTILAVFGPGLSILLLDSNTGSEIKAFVYGINSYRGHLIWSKDGQYIAIGNLNFTSVGVVDARNGQVVDEYYAHTYPPYSLAWLEGDTMLVSLGGGLLVVWDRERQIPQHVIHASDSYRDVAWSPDGSTVSAIDGINITAWDVGTGLPNLVIPVNFDMYGNYAGIKDMVMSPNGDRYATVSGDDGRYLDIWDAQTGESTQIDIDAEPGLAWSPDGNYIIARDRFLNPIIFDSYTGEVVRKYDIKPGDFYPWGVAWSPVSPLIAGVDGAVYLLDYQSGSQWYPLMSCGDGNITVTWSPDGSMLVALSTDGSIRICDPQADRLLVQLRGIPQQAENPDIAWSPDGKMLAVTAYRSRLIDQRVTQVENTLIIWDTTSWQPVRKLSNPLLFTSVAFSPDSKTLAIGSYDGTIWLIEP